MAGTLKVTENGSRTWTHGVGLRQAMSRLSRLGDVRIRRTELVRSGETKQGAVLSVVRYDGRRIKAEWFPS